MPGTDLLHGTDMLASTATASQPMETMARGLLMPSPRLRLMPGTDMVAFTAMASQLMADMAMGDTMARGLLMPSPRLRLMPGTVVLVRVLVQSVQLGDGVVKGRFCQLAGLVWRVENFIVEDREIECQTEADGVGGLHF